MPFEGELMIPTKLAILIASFAFSTAVMAAPAVPETGMKPNNMDSASCTKTSGMDRNANRSKDIAIASAAANGKAGATTVTKTAPTRVQKN